MAEESMRTGAAGDAPGFRRALDHAMRHLEHGGRAADSRRLRRPTPRLAWAHVDGAFGLWGNASPRYRGLLDGVALADSWAVDGHKWLNVPYDTGYAFVKDARPLPDAVSHRTSYRTLSVCNWQTGDADVDRAVAAVQAALAA